MKISNLICSIFTGAKTMRARGKNLALIIISSALSAKVFTVLEVIEKMNFLCYVIL
jgi:hypothetical protein